jgi:membrane protein implicated in regulation of membrane protease activity
VKTAAYYAAIIMLILFVGVVIFKLIFGTPCTVVGNYCVGDGWTIAGLAGTILGVSATVLGILGAFAVAAWWTGLEKRVSDQVNEIIKRQEENTNKRIDAIVAQQEDKVSKQIDSLFAKVNQSVQEDLSRVTDRIVHDFSEIDRQVKRFSTDIQLLGQQYENIKKVSVDAAIFGRPWYIEPLAKSMIEEYHMVEVAVRMVQKYLGYVDGFLSRSGSGETGQYMASLLKEGAPYGEFPYFWKAALRWRDEVNKFSAEHPDVVKQVNGQIEDYEQRLEKLRKSEQK